MDWISNPVSSCVARVSASDGSEHVEEAPARTSGGRYLSDRRFWHGGHWRWYRHLRERRRRDAAGRQRGADRGRCSGSCGGRGGGCGAGGGCDKAADAVVSGATAVQSATDAAAAAVQRDNGWFGFFTGPFESILKVCHLVPLQTLHTQLLCGRGMGSRSNCWYSASCNGRSRGVSLSGARCVCVQVLDSGLDKLHVPYSYGFAIILLTVLVKALTFPLSRKQVPCPALVASSLAAPSLLPQA